ncbi:LacI family DNA-binding transcriptional regulator [Prauserella flavalba]|uniref:LacI family DNA-binding transcriptional regulator n=1 Tax=Prauserella flavalba TaxID=1477506 RepID=UPI0036E09F16
MATTAGSGSPGRASLANVAKLAGVSTGTVSRALTRPEMISEATRARVLRAVEQLDYVANGSARSLAARRTMTVGAIVPRFGTSSFPIMIQSLESQLAADGYTLLLASPDHNDPRGPAILRTLLERGVDAVALLGADHPAQTFALLEAHQKPYVLMWGQTSRRKEVVSFHEQAAATLVVDHLHDLRHRAIAFIGGRTADNERARSRRRAMIKAARSRDIALPRGAVVESDYGFREGYDAMLELLGGELGFTAVVLGNDYLAAGALSALDQAGVRVPEDLSVASFNDNDFAAFLHPPLTTVRLPIGEIGREAARYLVGRLHGKPVHAPKRLPVELVVRASTGPVPR